MAQTVVADKKDVKFLEALGLQLKSHFSTNSHDVFKCLVEIKGEKIDVDLLRSLKRKDGEPLPASVKNGEDLLWSFQRENFKGVAKLLKVKGHLIIAFISYNQKLERILPVADLIGTVEAEVEGGGTVRIGGMEDADLAEVKIAAAHKLKMEANLTDNEKEARKNRQAGDEARQNVKDAQKREARKKRADSILARGMMAVFTPAGKELQGVPVVGNEWECLPPGKGAILVESYDEATGASGLIKHFYVSKSVGSKPKEERPTLEILPERPRGVQNAQSKGQPVVKKKVKLVKVEIDHEVKKIPHLESSDLKSLKEKKVNSSKPVAIGKIDANGMVQVIALQGKEHQDLGHFKVLQ